MPSTLPTPSTAASATCGALCVTPPAWFHVKPARGCTLDRLGLDDVGPASVTIAAWLAEAGGRHRLEVRLGTSGKHAGVWLGLATVGATPRDAADAHARAVADLAAGFAGFRWAAGPAEAPELPPARAAFRATDRVRTAHALVDTRLTLARIAPRGAPLVLRVRVDLSRGRPGLVSSAGALLREARVRVGRLEATGAPFRRVCDAEDVVSQLEAVRAEAGTVGLRLTLHGRRAPGRLPLRMFTDAVAADLAVNGAWVEAGAAGSVEADFGVLQTLVSMASLRRGRDSGRRLRLPRVDPDGLPPME